jgi:hypothetical protein
MYLLKYNRSHNENIMRLQKDLNLLVNDILPETDLIKLQNEHIESFQCVQNYIHKYFQNYIDKSVKCYNKIKNTLDDLENFNSNVDKYQLNYEMTFEIDFDDIISINDLLNNNIFVPEMTFHEIKLLNQPNFILETKFISNNIKKYDYEKFTEIFDCNYLFEIYEYPYFIISIKKNDEYIQHSSFYKEKKIFLRNSISNEIIYLNFNANLIYFNHTLNSLSVDSKYNTDNFIESNILIDDLNDILDKIKSSHSDSNYESEPETESVYESELETESEYDKKPHKFFISKNTIIVYDGPLYVVTKHINNNSIMLDNVEYQILSDESTFDVELLYNLMSLA